MRQDNTAGWYGDPSGTGYRYFDGHWWTNERRDTRPARAPAWWLQRRLVLAAALATAVGLGALAMSVGNRTNAQSAAGSGVTTVGRAASTVPANARTTAGTASADVAAPATDATTDESSTTVTISFLDATAAASAATTAASAAPTSADIPDTDTVVRGNGGSSSLAQGESIAFVPPTRSTPTTIAAPLSTTTTSRPASTVPGTVTAAPPTAAPPPSTSQTRATTPATTTPATTPPAATTPVTTVPSVTTSNAVSVPKGVRSGQVCGPPGSSGLTAGGQTVICNVMDVRGTYFWSQPVA